MLGEQIDLPKTKPGGGEMFYISSFFFFFLSLKLSFIHHSADSLSQGNASKMPGVSAAGVLYDNSFIRVHIVAAGL